ncbi:MAG TPA: TonB-dependent receptor [Pyrinomonadaceae bacterium]|nr:TonB-dependent receptor [Pyrinomonadaceae bacterium]
MHSSNPGPFIKRPGCSLLGTAIALIVITTSSVAAQGTIKGKVVADIPDQRKALAGVVVSLSGQRSGKKLQSISDEEGIYNFAGLIAGDYQLSVELTGFKKYEQKISVQIDATVEQDILLQPEAVSASVTVKQDPTDPTKTDTNAPGVLTAAALRDAPLIDQKFQDALPLLPGVVRGPDGTLNVKGTRASQSGILMSSLNVTDPVTGNPAIELPLEAVETVHVYANPYSAEYGKFTGAVTAIETRSGSNKLRYLLTGTLPRPRLRDGHIFGIGAATPRIAVGGPIKKDKLFFFQSLEYRFVRNNVPSLEDLNLPSDIKRESVDSFSRLDYVINPEHRLTISFSLFPQKLDYFNLNTFNPIETTANFHQRGWFLALNEQATFKSGALLQSSFSAKQYDGDIFGNSGAPYVIGTSRNFGGWYDRQHRDSRRYELLEIYNLAPHKWHGTHTLKAGFNYSRTSFTGTDTSRPVTIVRANGTRYQLIDFIGGGPLAERQNEYAAFVQDNWEFNGRLTLDAGLRFDRDRLGAQNNFAPRLGLVFLPTASERTVVRGGVGLFYDKIPLNIGAFAQYPSQRLTTFAANGVTPVDGPRLFRNTPPGDLRNPYSLAWNVQFDRQVTERLMFRLGYEERHTRREFIIEPISSANQLQLQSNGRSLYREFQAVARFRFQEGRNIFLSYVRSEARGDLNDYNTYFGNLRQPVIRPDEYGRQNFDAPNRLLFWGDFALPHQIVLTPVVEWRSGFPFSAVNEQQDFVGERNAAGRFPPLFTLDVLVMKGLAIPFKGKKYHGRAGITFFNLTNHFNPRDVQNNLASPQFGGFYNSPGLSMRLKFEFVKY